MDKVKLTLIRKEIDVIDDQLIPLLQQRFDLIEQLIPYKTNLVDRKRELAILSKIASYWVRRVYQKMFCVSKQFFKSQSQSRGF